MFIHKIDEEVSLRLMGINDAERVFELTNHNRDYLREWLPWLDTTKTVDDTKGFIQFCLKGYAESKSMNTVILFKEEIAGAAGFNKIDWPNKTAYIGYWLAAEYQGNGIMTKTARALTDYAIKELKLNRVEIRAAVENKKSRGIPERLGFVNEGCIREAEWLYDHYVDHMVYGMLEKDWNK